MNQPNSADPRENLRTNMFLGAVLRGQGPSIPVKVRNMSVAGALVEGPALPEEGAEVQLVRGNLEVSATVAWSSDGRCGLRFSSLACIRDWMAPAANSAQQHVDETVRVLKLGAVPMPRRSAAQTEATGESSQSVQFSEILRSIMRLIDQLAEELSGDGDIIERHGGTLQNIDVAVQTIAVVADALASGMSESAVAPRLDSLTASCAAALEKRT